MARGAQAKQEIFARLLETFEGSFMQDDKVLRVPMTEAGETVEIKVTLTAAKDVLGAGTSSNRAAGSTAVEEFDWSDNGGAAGGKSSVEAAAAADLSETEKANIRKMMEALGL